MHVHFAAGGKTDVSKFLDLTHFFDAAHGGKLSHTNKLERQRYLGKNRCSSSKSIISAIFSLKQQPRVPPGFLWSRGVLEPLCSFWLQFKRLGCHQKGDLLLVDPRPDFTVPKSELQSEDRSPNPRSYMLQQQYWLPWLTRSRPPQRKPEATY